MKVDADRLVDIYEETKKKAEVCLGIDSSINLIQSNDETRQINSFIVKELNDVLYSLDAELFDINICNYLIMNNGQQLIKILDVLNYFKDERRD